MYCIKLYWVLQFKLTFQLFDTFPSHLYRLRELNIQQASCFITLFNLSRNDHKLVSEHSSYLVTLKMQCTLEHNQALNEARAILLFRNTSAVTILWVKCAQCGLMLRPSLLKTCSTCAEEAGIDNTFTCREWSSGNLSLFVDQH